MCNEEVDNVGEGERVESEDTDDDDEGDDIACCCGGTIVIIIIISSSPRGARSVGKETSNRDRLA